MNCPNCHTSMTPGRGFWVCLQCGERGIDSAVREPGPLDDLIAELPHVLAATLEEYCRANTPYLKLHRLTAAAETLTRFCVVVLLADFLARPTAGFPDEVRRELVAKLERPTFGAWKALLEACLRATNARLCIVPDLPSYLKKHLLPELGPILDLRNTLAHSGRLAADDERAFMATFPDRFEKVLRAASFFCRVQVVASPEFGRAFVLRGNPDGGSDAFPSFDLASLPAGIARPGPDQLLLLSDGRAVDLFPLHAYGDVFHHVDRGASRSAAAAESRFERIDEASPAAMLYFRRGTTAYLDYTTCSPRAAHSQEGSSALEKFRSVFRLAEWRRQEEVRHARKEFDFSSWCAELLLLFRGRESQVEHVANWCRNETSGWCWIHGLPGIGKSAFMAALATRLFGDSRRSCRVVHFFRATDPRCNRMKFLENALTGLAAGFGRPEPLDPDPAGRTEQFARALNAAVSAEAEKSDIERKRIVFFLDGIDEITQNEPDFLNILFREKLPGVLWVCTGRDDRGLGRHFERKGAFQPFGPGGLPPLTESDLREILFEECGRQIEELIARDSPDARAGGTANFFLTELARRSEGLPLYLHLLAQDVREGRISFRPGEEAKLPHGLTSYYEQLLERLRISDVSAVLTPVFCLLAVAKAPLTLGTIRLLMAEDRLLRRQGGDELLRRALEFGHLMLKDLVVTEPLVTSAGEGFTETGYTLYHESFRDHLLESETVKESVGAAFDDFSRFIRHWNERPLDLFSHRYALRHGPAHLLERNDVAAVAQLLCTPEFLEEKAVHGMIFGLVNDLSAAKRVVSPDDSSRLLLSLLAEAVSRDVHFLAGRPGLLFPCLWNSGWWYDSPEATAYYDPPNGGWSSEGAPWDRPAPERLSAWLESWRAVRGTRSVWLRALVPPSVPLGAIPQQVLRGHDDWVLAVASSPDRRRLVTSSADRTIRVWDSESGEQVACLRGHHGGVECIAISPDGQRIVSGGEDCTLRVWDLAQGSEIRAIHLPAAVRSVAWSPDGRDIAAAAGRAVYFVIAEGEATQVLPEHEGTVQSLSFAPDGTALASADGNHVIVWSCGNRDEPEGLSQSAASTVGPTVVDFAGFAGSEARRRRWSPGAVSVAFSPDGSSLVTASVDRTVRIYDVAAGKEILSFEGQETGSLTSVAYSPNGGFLITGSGAWVNDHSVRVWDATDGSLVFVLDAHENDVTSVAPCGRGLVSGSRDGTARIWHLHEARPAPSVKGLRPWGDIWGLAFSPDADSLLTARMGGTVQVADARTGLETVNIDRHTRSAWPSVSAEFSPDGLRLLTTGDDTVRVCDVATGRELLCLLGHQGEVSRATFSPDGRCIASAGQIDATVRTWDSVSGEARACFRGHTAAVRAVAFSPNGQRIASVSDDRTVRVFDVLAGTEVACLRGHDGPVHVLAFGPAGAGGLLASGSLDEAVIVWSLEDGKQCHRYPGHRGGVAQIAFAGEGDRVFTASETGLVREWELATGACVRTLEGIVDLPALAAGASTYPFRLRRTPTETLLESAHTGDVLTSIPLAPERIATRPDGVAWAASSGSTLYLFALEDATGRA